MKKLALLFIIMTLGIVAGCAQKAGYIQYGVYPVKSKILTFFDLMSKDFDLYGQTAELTESKPENLIVDPAIPMDNPQYGSFTFGNNNVKVWFVMGQDPKGYWTEFYIDQNLDNQITPKEKVKGFETANVKENKFNVRATEGLIPVPIQVSYKGENGPFIKKLFFFLNIKEIEDPHAKGIKNEIVTFAIDASFLEGEFPVQVGKTQQNCRFRIYDANGNGCFNDFGNDLLHIDLNHDGFFKKAEVFKLVEFMDRTENNHRTQYRLVVMPYPAKVALLNSLEEYNPADFEPASDPPDKNQAMPVVSPSPSPQSDTPKAGSAK